MALLKNLTSVAKILGKNPQLVKNISKINDKTSEELTNDTSIFNKSKENIVQKGEDEKQKLLEEEQRRQQEEEEKKKKQKEEEERKRQEEEKKKENEAEKETEEETEASKDETVTRKSKEEALNDFANKKGGYTYDRNYKEELREKAANDFSETSKAIFDQYQQNMEEIREQRKERGTRATINDLLGETGKRLLRQTGNYINKGWQDFNTVLPYLGLWNEGTRNVYYRERMIRKDMEEEQEVQKVFNDQSQLLLQQTIDETGISDEYYEQQMEEIRDEYGTAITEYSNFYNKDAEHTKEYTRLEEELKKAEESGDTTLQENIKSQMEYHEIEAFRDYYEYVLGQKFEGSTKEEIAKDINKKTGLAIKDIMNGDNSLWDKKVSDVIEGYGKIEDLNTKYDIRSNYNVGQLPSERMIRTLGYYGAILGSDGEEAIWSAYTGVESDLRDFDIRIKNSQNTEEANRLQQEKYNYMQGMSWYTQYLDNAALEILGAGKDTIEPTKNLVLALYKSDEAKALRKLITNPELINKYKKTDSKGNTYVDYVELGKYLEKTDEVRNFGALAGAYKQKAQNLQKAADYYVNKEDGNPLKDAYYWSRMKLSDIFGSPQKGTQYVGSKYQKILLEYLMNGGDINQFSDKYIKDHIDAATDFSVISNESKEAIKANMVSMLDRGDEKEIETFKKELDKLGTKGQNKGDIMTDRVTEGIEDLDVLNAMNSWVRFGRFWEHIGDSIQANPGDTLLTTTAMLLPFLPGEVRGTADVLSLIMKGGTKTGKLGGLGRTIWNGTAEVLGEVIEGEMMNLLLDSTSYGDANAYWNILDGTIGMFKAIPLLRAGYDLSKFRKSLDVEKIVQDALGEGYHGAAALTNLTRKEKNLIDTQFKNEGWGYIVGKLTDNIDENGKIDYVNLYKKYQTNAPLILGVGADATNESLLHKIQLAGYKADLEELDNRVVDAMYKRAIKWIGSEGTVEKLLKNGGKKDVVAYRLTGELNTLSKVAKVKGATVLTQLVEAGKDSAKEMNDNFKNLISIFEQKKAATTDPHMAEFLQQAIDDTKELWTAERLLPLQLSETRFQKALDLYNVKLTDWNSKYSSLLGSINIKKDGKFINRQNELVSVLDGGVSGLDDEIVNLWKQGKRKEIAEMILGDQANFEKIGVKTYNIDEYRQGLREMSGDMLTEGQQKRVSQILDILDKINNNEIRIIELPDDIRKKIEGMQGFMGYLGKNKTEPVIVLSSSLIGGAMNKKFSDIKVLTHELGHVLLGSLKQNVKNKLLDTIFKLTNKKEIGEKLLTSLVPNISEKRIDFLKGLYKKDVSEFIEELAADMLGESIVKGIRGGTDATEKVGDSILRQMAGGKGIKEFVDSSQPFQIIGNKFTDMLNTLYDTMSTQKSYTQIRGIMDYIAASILAGGDVELKSVKRATTWKDAKNAIFGRKGSKFHSYDEMLDGTAMDNEGKILSLGQERYFKDSKIVDDDGRLLRVYHGTNADPFEIFNIDFARKNSDIQGAFFSPRYDEAKGYGKNIGAYYLNVKNPAPRGLAYKIFASFEGQNDRGVLTRIELQKRGYDGVISHGDEIIVFSPEQIKAIDNRVPTKSPNFHSYQEEVNKADFNYGAKKGDKSATLDRDFTMFDVAKVSSVTAVKRLVEDATMSAEDIAQLLSMKWLDIDLQSNILEGVSDKNIKKFQRAMTLAEERQGILGDALLKFWKNGKIDLTQEIDGLTFSDLLANLAPRVTDNGYVERAGVDLIKFINNSDKEKYNELFYNFMNTLETEYNDEVIAGLVKKLQQAGIDGKMLGAGFDSNDFAAMWVVLTNKVEDSLYQKAIAAKIDEKLAKDTAQDITSRLFAGSFYYMSNLHFSEITNPAMLIDDLAYGILLKNKAQAEGRYFNKMYNGIIAEYEKVNGLDGTMARWLSTPKQGYIADLLSDTPEHFRWRRYETDVFNNLATRTAAFITTELKDMGGSLNISKQDWAGFFNKVVNQKSQIKDMIGNKMIEKGLGPDVIDIVDLKNSRSIDEICDAYIKALKSKNAKILEVMPDKSERDAVINELEKIKAEGFSDADYDKQLNILEGKYKSYAKDDMSLSDYFDSVLTQEEISALNKADRDFMRASVEPIPPTWTKELQDSYKDIDETFLDPELIGAFDTLTKEFNDWTNLVKAGEEGDITTIMSTLLNKKAFSPYFNVKDEGTLMSLKTKLTTSTNKSIRKIVLSVGSDNDKKQSNTIRRIIGSLVNAETVASKDKEVGRIVEKATNFVYNKSVYIGDGAIGKFYDLKGGGGEKTYYTVRTVVNDIIDSLNKSVKKGVSAANIFSDIHKRYTVRFPASEFIDENGNIITQSLKPEVYKGLKGDELKKQFTWVAGDKASDEYKAAIEAYVDILAKRHGEIGLFGNQELRRVLDKLEEEGLKSTWRINFASKGGKKSREASRVMGLAGMWLGASSDEIKYLEKGVAAIWHPDLFNNFLYKSFSTVNVNKGFKDFAVGLYTKAEDLGANMMYGLFYNMLAGLPAGSQQVLTNYIEITSKTLSELADIDINPEVYSQLCDLVGDLMPSEIMSLNKKSLKFFGTRPELENTANGKISLNTRWNKLSNGLKKLVSGTSALTWADKSVEGAVIRYSLVASLMDMGFNGESTKELVSSVLASMADLERLKVEDVMDVYSIIKEDKKKIRNIANNKINSLVEAGTITREQGVEIFDKIIELNGKSEPLRYAAKQANFKKNVLYQMGRTPDMLQNLLGGRAGAANMRFLNWASRKAGEYAFNFADAILKGDKSLIYKYISAATYRGLIATKIYAQLNKATNDQGGISYYDFVKNMFLPLVVLNMTLCSALDIIEETAHDIQGGGDLISSVQTMLHGLLGIGDNLKGRLSSSLIYWGGQAVSAFNSNAMLSEKAAASDYFSGPSTSIPVVGWILETIWNTLTKRYTKYSEITMSGIYKDNGMLSNKDTIINAILNAVTTNNAIGIKDRIDRANTLAYGEDGFSLFDEGKVSIDLIPYSRNSKYAFQAYVDFLRKSGLMQAYLQPDSTIDEVADEFNHLMSKSKYEQSVSLLGLDVEEYEELSKIGDDWSDLGITGEELVKLQEEYPTYREDAVLNHASLSSSSYQGVKNAGKGLSPTEKKEYTERVNRLYNEMLKEIQDKMKTDPKSLKPAASQNNEAIRDLIKKYGNTYGEQLCLATAIKAEISAYKSARTKYYKKQFSSDLEYQNWLKQGGGKEEIAGKVAEEKYRMVRKYYPTLKQGQQLLANNMMFSHAQLREDNPLSSKLSMTSSLGIAINLDTLARNIDYQGLDGSNYKALPAELTERVLNSKNATNEEKLEFIEETVDFIDTMYDPLTSAKLRAGMSAPILKNFVEMYNTAIATGSDFFEDQKNIDAMHEAMDAITVSRPLSDEDIKKEVRESVLKSTKSGSGSGRRGRKGSIGFNKLAQDLTKFQAFKRQFEENVMHQEPLSKIAYKASKTGITPIQLSVGEAHEIDKKYSFITPKQPESEKTPDIVVKQVKTTSSKYSGKAIKQSNVYKVKKVL